MGSTAATLVSQTIDRPIRGRVAKKAIGFGVFICVTGVVPYHFTAKAFIYYGRYMGI